LGRFYYLEIFFGIGKDNIDSLIGLEGGVDKQLSDKCTLVKSEVKTNRVMLSINIILSISLLTFFRRDSILSIIARLLGEKSLIKLIL